MRLENDRPNVLVIMADDMGYGDLGVFGNGIVQTPNLDKLTQEGTTLTQYYSPSPVCAPARAAFYTGRYNHRTGAIDMREMRGLSSLSLDEVTMGDVFQKAGYATGLIGKWHNGTFGKRYHPNMRGFDYFFGFRGGLSDYYNYSLWRNQEVTKYENGQYLTELLTDEAIRFVTERCNQPFFLQIAYNAPHTPLEAPEEDIARFRESGQQNEAVSVLYGMIYNMDKNIKRVLDTLDELNLRENTIVLFLSDNGPQFVDDKSHSGKCLGDTFRYNGCLRGNKCQVFEGGINVPAIIRWPGRIPQNRLSDTFVHGTDWLPTFAAACGLDLSSTLPLDGRNVLSALVEGKDGYTPDRCWQWNRYDPEKRINAAIRDGAWKLVYPPVEQALKPNPEDCKMDRDMERNPEKFTKFFHGPHNRHYEITERPMLFNLETDPGETHDVADLYPERVAAMSRSLDAWYDSVERDRARVQLFDDEA